MLVMWVPLFSKEQGHPTETNCVSSKGMHMINVQHLMVMDLVKKGQLDTVCCPTNEMTGDHFTKSLQGTKFSIFQKIIMGA